MPRCIICDGSSETNPEFYNVSYIWDTQAQGYICVECVANIPYDEWNEDEPLLPEEPEKD